MKRGTAVSRSGPDLQLVAAWLKREQSADVSADLASARMIVRSWAAGIRESQRASFAAQFTRTALDALASEISPHLQLSQPVPPTISIDDTAKQLAAAMGRLAAELPLIDSLHELTGLYTALLPQGQRSELGAFYTPPALGSRLADLATEAGLDWKSARVLDPACGGAVLLIQAAKRMLEALEGSEPAFALAQLGNRLVGYEVDPNAAILAQNAFEIFVASLAEKAGRAIPQIIRIGDALNVKPAGDFDLVIGNPPYGRVALTPELRARFARSLYGHANLYGVFTDLAVGWSKPGGMIAYLTPTSFLGGQYYAALRGLLASEAPPVAIDFVHARRGVFEDVLQETMLALYQRNAKPGRFQVHYLTLENRGQAKITKNGTVALPEDAKGPWLAPRAPSHAQLIAHVEGMKARLADWNYEVSTGPLVWNRFKPQLKEKPARDTLPLVWAESVLPDGRFVFRALKKNHVPYFQLKTGDAWLRVADPCVLVQRTTAKEQNRRLIAAAMPAEFVSKHGGVVVENHLNMVRPAGEPKVSPAAVAAVLNSHVVDQVFRCISGSVAVSAFELEALPLPTVAEMAKIETLLKQHATRATIEKAITALYTGEAV